MTDRQFVEIKGLITKSNRWGLIKDCIVLIALGGSVSWNLYCQSTKAELKAAQTELALYREERKREHAERQAQIDALKKIADDLKTENREFRRIQAMQAEDPKRLGMIDAQHRAIKNYERTRASSGTGGK